jgi:anti-repressor protein
MTNTDTLMTFTASTGVTLRTMELDGQVYFVGKDVATMLGYKDTVNALKQFCRGVVKRHPIVDALGRTQEVRIIGEPDFYRLVVNSKLPAAQEYERWVFEEVLPAIRRKGAYVASTGEETLEELMSRALSAANEAIARQKARLAAQEQELAMQDITIKSQALELETAQPKVLFADAVATSDNCILIGELAKLIRQNGYDIGQNRLFVWLRENGYLMKSNRPTQRAMDMQLFKVVERTVLNPDGSSRLTLTTKVTGKGQQYFINIFLKSA